jgi:hypothetical protein
MCRLLLLFLQAYHLQHMHFLTPQDPSLPPMRTSSLPPQPLDRHSKRWLSPGGAVQRTDVWCVLRSST